MPNLARYSKYFNRVYSRNVFKFTAIYRKNYEKNKLITNYNRPSVYVTVNYRKANLIRRKKEPLLRFELLTNFNEN